MTQESKLEWTEYKSRFRAITAYGTYWVDTAACSAGYQLICGTNPCCVAFHSPQEAKDYAQTIHDRPTRRDYWFNLSDVEQAPYHAPLDLSELLRTYETLLAGDNLSERIAVQTVDLRALLIAANLHSQMLSNAADADTSFTTAVRAAGTALIELTSIVEWEKHNHYSQVIMNLAIALDLFGAPTLSDHWHDISLLGERELGRLIVIGAFDGKGRWCATVRRAQRFIDHHNENAGSLKKAMRLKWEPTHFMEVSAPHGLILAAAPAQNNQPPVCCTHCNSTKEIQRPDSEFLSPCPECAPTLEAGQ
ncbi:hypothetical protein [Pseudochrobactrum kiredjianiae]|uniref:Uncharacterized protein n=1 Tax=Pseudochrobactrum kiredjianiae TaxID=386305 RepID=A0ABW3V4I7_9HYPH|nr:hypothetical protein [Pseudochrobactrum kiredjianiae]MDM7852649.1 hypothetical protein [Pseudochrobactrum kiredjianiae]